MRAVLGVLFLLVSGFGFLNAQVVITSSSNPSADVAIKESISVATLLDRLVSFTGDCTVAVLLNVPVADE